MTNAKPISPYELLAREVKAHKIAEVLHAAGVSVSDLEQCRPSTPICAMAARQADVKLHSLKTCEAVCSMLRLRERKGVDPFEKFEEASS